MERSSENVIDKKVETIESSLFPSTEINYKGVSMTIPKAESFVPLIKYGFSDTEEILAASFQSLTNGRLAIIGSVEMFNDENYENNKKFIQPLIQWVLQLHGKLELKNVQITKLDGKPDIENEGMFFTNDTVSVRFDIEETMNGETKGYSADDVQVEYRYVTPVILDYATNMKNGTYDFTTVLPDQFGVYTIRINYTRPLLTNLYYDKVTPIRPWRHDHVERFQVQCYPFYLAFFLMSISAVIFVFFYFLLFCAGIIPKLVILVDQYVQVLVILRPLCDLIGIIHRQIVITHVLLKIRLILLGTLGDVILGKINVGYIPPGAKIYNQKQKHR